MELFVLAAAVLASAYVVVPLARDEDDLEALNGPPPGVRDLTGASAEERTEGPTPRERRCPACGARVEPAFDLCGACVRPCRSSYPSPTADSPTGSWPSMCSVPPMYGWSASGTSTVPSSFW